MASKKKKKKPEDKKKTKKPIPAATGPHRGTGHPNKILFTDYAFTPPRRSFQVETNIDLTEDLDTYEELEELLKGRQTAAKRKEIVRLAHGKVSKLGGELKDKDQAKKMFSAAFAVEDE